MTTNGPMGFLLVNDGNEWIKYIELHKLLEESTSRENPYLCLSEEGGNIIRLAIGMTVYC